VEFLGGKETSAVGFAIGIERILELIDLPNNTNNDIYAGAMQKEAIDTVFELSIKLKKNHKTHFDYKTKSLKTHLKSADKLGSRFCMIVGEDELKSKTVWLKDLKNKKETTIPIDKIYANNKIEE